MMMNPRRGLARQINRRLLFALLLASVFSALVGLWIYHESNRRAHEERVVTLHKHLAATLTQIERTWGREAYNFRTRLEYARLLEDPARRAIRLTTYLTAQGGSPLFPFVRVLDAAGKPVAEYAYGLDRFPEPILPPGLESAWGWDQQGKQLYRVFLQQVWLGNGNGTLQLLKPIDHSLLNSFDLPETNVAIFWENTPLASSLGQAGMDALPAALALHGTNTTHWLEWAGSGPQIPRLFIAPNHTDAFSPADLAIPLSIATLIFALAAWVTLGRWSVLSLRRIQALRYVQERFAEDRSLDNEIDYALTVVRAKVDDEITDLADTMRMMMHTIVVAERSEIEAREKLEHNERQFRLIVEGTHVITWEYDLAAQRYDYVSPQAEAILGYAPAAWQAPDFFARLLPDSSREATLSQRRRNFAAEKPAVMEYRIIARDGQTLWLQDQITPLPDARGRATRVLGISLDITERKAAEEKLLLSDLVVNNTSEGVVITDADNRIVWVNPAFEAISGYAATEVIGLRPNILKSGLHDDAFYQNLWGTLSACGRWSGEIWNRNKNGALYAQRSSIVTVMDAAGKPWRHIALCADITIEKQQEEELAYQAAHDPLTGLPNRRLLGDRIESSLARARRDNRQVALFLLDLDGFKHINDTQGHQVGDLVLVEVAKRVHGTLRETDTLARIGGDEFVIVAEGLQDQADIQGIAAKVLENIQKPLHINHSELYVTTSIGITVFPTDGKNKSELFTNADTALYRAKVEGRNTFRFFTAQMHESALARMEIETELRHAIPNEEFVLYYQPVIELATGRLAKAEALVRWQHPLRGMVPPNDFIPVAEDTGMILPLGSWIIGEAARQAAEWHALSAPGFKICVNFSAYQFRRSDPIGLLADALAASGMSNDRLSIEITESLFMEDEGNSLAQLHLLREKGFEIAIDDFGTGYSSLSYLQRLPVDILKIDRSFVMGIPDEPKSMSLVDAMLSLGHSFGIAVIAEGIETAAQQRFLTERGCKYGQGYLFDKPLPAVEFARKYFGQ